MKHLILTLFFLICITSVQASLTFVNQTFSNKLDHFNETDERFYNHTYMTNFDFNTSSDSINVLELIGPEDYLVRPYIEDKEKGALFNFSQEWKAKLFQLEHRYYGSSNPFPNTRNIEDFQYLTTS